MKRILLITLCFIVGIVITSCDNDSNKETNNNKAWFEEDGDYTYNVYINEIRTMNWNPLDFKMYYDNNEFEYLSMGFYEYQLNNTFDSWEVIPEMAKDFPIDVTMDYVGQYGIKAGEKGKAWAIPLNEAAKWENGVNITANDYVYSMKQLLDPIQCYRGADFYCGGSFSIYNARNYLNSLYDGFYETPAALGYESVQDAIDEGVMVYLDVKDFMNINCNDAVADIIGATNDGTLVPLTSTVKIRNYNVNDGEEDWVSAYDLWLKYQDSLEVGCKNHSCLKIYVQNEYKDLDFNEVGIFAKDDYTLIIVLENELLNPKFYLPYYLSRNWLINEGLYEVCWTETPEGLRINTYMTSKATTISYGPYVLSNFDSDKHIIFTRNTEWYGYYDNKHQKQYQTDTLCYQVIKEHENAIIAYENGELDFVNLDISDLDNYSGSQYLLYMPQSSTTKLTFNTRLNTLTSRESEGINKRILSVRQFREALSLCINRTYLTMNFISTSSPMYTLFNQTYKIINEQGIENSYRNFDPVKQAIVELYGIEYGNGTKYRDLNSAYRAITGYDIKKACSLMQEAYDYAVQNGLYLDGEVIKLRLSVSKSESVDIEMYEYLESQFNKAVTGTSLEGMIELEIFYDDNYYNSFNDGETDIIFTSSGYSEYDMFNAMSQVYCNNEQMKIKFDPTKIPVTITLRDCEYTYSLKEWSDWLSGTQTLVKLGHDCNWTIIEKITVLAACEKAYLGEYYELPLYYNQSVFLHSKKITYGSNAYISLVGFGGLRHMTYNYTDEEWKLVNQQD